MAETREFLYAYQAAGYTDALNKAAVLNPNDAVTPTYAAIIQGPTQIDVRVSNLCENTHGEQVKTLGVPTVISGTQVFQNPFAVFYKATLREIRFIGYWITCQPNQLDGIISQLNPSNSVLPSGVTVASALQQSSARAVVLYDPNNTEVPWPV